MKYISLIFWVLIFSAALPAQEKLSLGTVWQMLDANNYDLIKQKDLLEQLQLDYQIQSAGYLPTVNVKAGYNYVSELAKIETPFLPTSIEAGAKNQYDVSLNIAQPVFTGFRTGNLMDAAEAGFNAASFKSDALKNALRQQAGLLYYEIKDRMMAKRVLEQSVSRADARLNIARDLLAAEQATSFDTLEAANRKLQVQHAITKLDDAQLILLSKLKFLLNANTLPEIAVPDVPSFNPPDTPLQHFIDLGLKRRPELESIRYARSAGEFQTSALRSTYYPQVFAQASWHYARPGVNFFQDEWMDFYTFGVSLQWNLWNGQQDNHKIEKARLEVNKLSTDELRLKSEIGQQIEEAWYLMQSNRKQIELLRRLEKQETDHFRIISERFASGQSSAIEVQLVEASLTEAQLNLQREYIGWFINRLHLYYASGILKEFQGGF